MTLADKLTLFTTCKPFIGEALQTQTNALITWAAHDFPFMICGQEEGTADAAAKFGAQHIREIECNDKGFPYIRSIFSEAERNSSTPWMAYVNSDIILTRELVAVITAALETLDPIQPTLLSFRRLNIPVTGGFSKKTWEADLLSNSERYGSWDQSNAIDFFLFNRGLFDKIPPLVVGYMGWDNWLLWKARENGASIIDGSLQAELFHPIHGYSSDGTGLIERSQGYQAVKNRQLTAGKRADLNSATTHVLIGDQIARFTGNHRNHLKKHCAPDYDKELLAGLKYLSSCINIRTAPEILDCCRTILWRQERFYPLLETGSVEVEQLTPTVLQASDLAESGQLTKAAAVIEAVVATNFIDRLRDLSQSRELYIWGAGARGKRLLEFLKTQNLSVSGFLDRSADKQGLEIAGRLVLGDKIDHAGKRGDFHIIIASMYASEISEDFDEAGLEPLRDYSA